MDQYLAENRVDFITLQIGGTSPGGSLVRDCRAALTREGEGGEKQEVFSPVTSPYIHLPPLLLKVLLRGVPPHVPRGIAALL